MAIDVPVTPRAVVGCVIVYNAFFGYRYSRPSSKPADLLRNDRNSWGPIPWLYPPEIMPLTVRAKGVSLSTATNWFFNFIVGLVTPYLQEVIEWRLYPMHGFFCVCSFIVVYFREHRFLSTEPPDLTSCKSVPRNDGHTTRGDGRRIWRGCDQIRFLTQRSLTPRHNLDELHGFYENRESEQASLVGGAHSGRSPTRRLPSTSFLQAAREWFSGVVNKRRDRSAYEPITGDE